MNTADFFKFLFEPLSPYGLTTKTIRADYKDAAGNYYHENSTLAGHFVNDYEVVQIIKDGYKKRGYTVTAILELSNDCNPDDLDRMTPKELIANVNPLYVSPVDYEPKPPGRKLQRRRQKR